MMVELMRYPFHKLLDKCRGHSDSSFISIWRSKGTSSSTSGRSIIQKDNRKFDTDKREYIKRGNIKMFKINPSMDTIKSIDRGVSEYWGDALRYHWPIAIQSFFLVIIILTLGPWIGIRSSDDVSIDANKNEQSSIWRPFMGFIESSKSPSIITTRERCTYGYFCSNNKKQDGEPVRRRASFLKRKRYLKDFIG